MQLSIAVDRPYRVWRVNKSDRKIQDTWNELYNEGHAKWNKTIQASTRLAHKLTSSKHATSTQRNRWSKCVGSLLPYWDAFKPQRLGHPSYNGEAACGHEVYIVIPNSSWFLDVDVETCWKRHPQNSIHPHCTWCKIHYVHWISKPFARVVPRIWPGYRIDQLIDSSDMFGAS